MTELQLEDNLFIHLGDPTQFEESIFTISHLENRPFEFDDYGQIAVTFQMNLNRIYVDRSVYTFLDFIGDLGGL